MVDEHFCVVLSCLCQSVVCDIADSPSVKYRLHWQYITHLLVVIVA